MITADNILSDLKTMVYRTVAAAHGESRALSCVRAVVDCLYLNFRRQLIYVPTPLRHNSQVNIEHIWHDFNGRNHIELATKYRVSTQWVYRVIKQMRKRHTSRYQSDLFPKVEENDPRPALLAVLQDYLPADLQRAGLPAPAAAELANAIADHLTAHYSGISIKITGELWHSHRGDDGNHDLFGMTA